MSGRPKWDRCITQRGDEVRTFVKEYLAESQRRTLLIAGAGFDPRSVTVSQLLEAHKTNKLSGIFIREERLGPDGDLLARADGNLGQMRELVPNSREETL